MSHLQCPTCGIRFATRSAPAPSACPRCLLRRRGRFELVSGSDHSLQSQPPPNPGPIAMQSLRLTERRGRSGCLEILVEGEVDLAVADELEQAIERAASQFEEVLIGLQGCDFIDSTGIAVIVNAHTRMAAEGRRLAVYGPTSQVHRVLSITGLTENGLVFATLDGALSE